jgi:phosphomannomutase
MDEKGNFVDPHKIMALALRHLVQTRKLTGSVVRTVSTTRMIDRLAAKYGLTLHETPVGFNHIADYMMKENVLIGGEESGGISFQGHIPEGDGPIMGLLIIEMVAMAKTSLYEMVEDLQREVGPVFYERTDLRLKHPVAKDAMVKKLVQEPPSAIGGESITQVTTIDGVKYILADDSWLLIRPSGTEPVLRVYAEGRSPEMVKALLNYGETIAASVQ